MTVCKPTRPCKVTKSCEAVIRWRAARQRVRVEARLSSSGGKESWSRVRGREVRPRGVDTMKRERERSGRRAEEVLE